LHGTTLIYAFLAQINKIWKHKADRATTLIDTQVLGNVLQAGVDGEGVGDD